jgi:hypothetical protein
MTHLENILDIPDPEVSEWQRDRWNHFDLRGATAHDIRAELALVMLRLRLDLEPHPWLRLREGALLDALEALGRA